MKNFLYFLGGVVAGSLSTFFVTRNYFKRISDEEIASVKKVFSFKKQEEVPNKVLECSPIVRDDTSIFDEQPINKDVENSNVFVPSEEDSPKDPYVIYPYEYGETGFDTVELIHFSDGYLTDDRHEIVEDVTNTVGDDYASHFGEYEADSVFVRNERLKVDYEILLDERSYISLVSKYKGTDMKWEDL